MLTLQEVNHSGVNTCGPGTFCCRGTDNCDCDADSPRFFTLDPVRLIADPTAAASQSISSASSMSGRASSPAASGPSASWTATTGSLSGSSSTSLAETSTLLAEASATLVVGESDENGESDDNGFAVGLGAGLGVGIPVAALALAGIWFVRRRRKTKARTQTQLRRLDSREDGENDGRRHVVEKSTLRDSVSGMAEMGDSMGRQEMEGGNGAVELPASTKRGW
jgi:hypothetical protein